MRLLTYNIHKGIGGRDRRYDLDRVIDVIRAEKPDVVCLQEVDRHVSRSSGHDQPRLLADALELPHHHYQLNVHLQHGGYGNLLLSRWPARVHHSISLRLDARKPRAAQVVVLESPRGPVQVVNWHLGLSESERRWQVQRLLGHHSFVESAALPTIIAGDTNDWRNTLAGGEFARHGFRHLTAPVLRYRTFPGYFALGSLDKAYVRGLDGHFAVKVVNSPLAKQASDHLPVVVEHLP